MIEGSSMSDEEYYHLNGALSRARTEALIEAFIRFQVVTMKALAALEEFINTFDDEEVATAIEPALDLLRGEGET